MSHVNIEIKARCENPDRVREILKSRKARFVGEDHQIDTYFNVAKGRLKLREGNIENNLIFYSREDKEGPKRSDVTLYKSQNPIALKEALTNSNGVKIVVDKRREIYFIDNVKFHIDRVVGLGSFVEIEAIDEKGDIGSERLNERCHHFLDLLEINEESLLKDSYSDMLLANS